MAPQRRAPEVEPERVELGERRVGGARPERRHLAPRPDQQQLRTRLDVVGPAAVERVERELGGAARPRRVAQRAAAPDRGAQVRVDAGAGVGGIDQPHGGVERRERALAAPQLRERLGQLQPHVRVVRAQLDGLLEVRRRLDERGRLRRVGGRLHEPGDREVVAAREPQVVRGLGGAPAGRAAERLVQQRAAGVVEVGERGLAQQVVAEAEAPVGAAEQPAVHRREHGLGRRQRRQLDAVERPAGDRGELGRPARRLVEPGDRRADRAAQRGGRALVPARRGARALEREQRVAVGGRDDALALRRGERGDLADERLELAAAERLERELAHGDAAAARGMGERVDRVAPRDHAPREHEQHRKALDPPREIGRQLERRRVGEVDVVEQQHERPVGRRVLGELDRRLEQPRAGEVGRHLGGLDPRAPEPQRQRRGEPRELLRPAGVGGRRLELARQPGQQLDPGRERRRAAEVRRGAAGGARVARAGAGDQLEREPRLADPGLAADHRHAAAAGSHRLPQRGQLGQLAVATHERRPVGRGDRRRRPVRALRGRPLRPRGSRRRATASGRRARGRARRAGDRRAGRRRRARPARSPASTIRRIRSRAASSSSGSSASRRRAQPTASAGVAAAAASRASAEPSRSACSSRASSTQSSSRSASSGPRCSATAASSRPAATCASNSRQVGLAAQRDAVAARDQGVVVGERPPQLPQRAAQRRARARVEDVGPEARGDRAARVLARMQREPRQQRPRAAAGGHDDGGAVDLGLQVAEETHSQHGRQAYTGFDARLTGR